MLCGPICARTFSEIDECGQMPALEWYAKMAAGDGGDGGGESECDVRGDWMANEQETVDKRRTQSIARRADNGGRLFNMKGGKPRRVNVNLPLGRWDYRYRSTTGDVNTMYEKVSPFWKERIRWAVKQDTTSELKLDPEQFMKNADDFGLWARSMHRYAQIAIIADLVGLSKEKEIATRWVKNAFDVLMKRSFDNRLFYDASWGGIVPCGCDRKAGKGKCTSLPRTGYSDLYKDPDEPHQQDSWRASACLSMGDVAVEAGAGLFYGLHALFGHLVYMGAVLAKLSPSWPNMRVRIQTPQGVRSPKNHHFIMALIRNYATPESMYPYNSPAIQDVLTRDFIPSRHKDWWTLMSLSSGIEAPTETGMYQESASEAVFAYYAVMLYGDATNDKDLANWGSVLTATEMYAANTYYHVKEFTEIYPTALRYAGAMGTVSEMAATAGVKDGLDKYKVYSAQTLPFTLSSLETLEAGWMLWMAQRWSSVCQQDVTGCKDSGSDSTLALAELFTQSWRDNRTHVPTESEAKKKARDATYKIGHIRCFQQLSPDCGMHTLSNSLYWAAISQTVHGATRMIEEGKNQRYAVF
eukprot:GHVN01032285.1.p1 GENE.GHVN01032285.1~~GHVN01032285.1.p1  ORF type:complete len:582 (+),score=86.67 GHVN01032285.1:81-1826(+)